MGKAKPSVAYVIRMADGRFYHSIADRLVTSWCLAGAHLFMDQRTANATLDMLTLERPRRARGASVVSVETTEAMPSDNDADGRTWRFSVLMMSRPVTGCQQNGMAYFRYRREAEEFAAAYSSQPGQSALLLTDMKDGVKYELGEP